MDAVFSKLAAEWEIISAAPYSFILALLIASGAIWFVTRNLIYGTILANKISQIETLNGRIADYQDKLKGASPEQAAGEIQTLRHQLAETNKQLARLASPPRDRNAIYQNGVSIGKVAKVEINMSAKFVVFEVITIQGEIDAATNFEFRDLILAFSGSGTFSQVRLGLSVTSTYHDARFSIVGNRAS